MRKFKTERLPGGTVKEFYSDETGRITIRTRQEVSRVIQGVRDYAELSDTRDMKYAGSIPMSVAVEWSRDCGAAPGTREFAEYAKKKLNDGSYAHLNAGMRL